MLVESFHIAEDTSKLFPRDAQFFRIHDSLPLFPRRAPPGPADSAAPYPPSLESCAENKEPLAINMNPNVRTNTNLDRRQTFRKVPEKFAFIQLERDDGGAVLNVSEGSLSFSTFAPVYQTGPIHFWFSLNLNERIDAWGEVTWTDETKKLGGLRFIRLPERAERQIREWISRPVARQAPDERYAPQAIGGRPPKVASREPDAAARFVSKARSQRPPARSNDEDSRGSMAPLPSLVKIQAATRFAPEPRAQRPPRLSTICGSAAFN